ncbi:cellulose synthase operon protein YhjQ/BcsQ [Terriglobus aquaticus]|uniref:Cellulose synthase operon protein YhjQ/BcsQ n=1 Tax=Terriglobus aquaticus TaxID=940139 RepID=A0ABW9KJ01_9BACT|nr:cellulose synthase operon protein YhjQ/BcsQ [Terriglobus aquaticus]
MDNANARADEQPLAPETPEDVAILYSWANLPGAKYRDFSASRREYRAQQRARAAEAQRQAELKAARELEEAAQQEVERAQKQLEASRQAEAKAAADAAADAEAKRHAEEILRRAEERAEQERQEALRRQQSAEDLRVMAERAQEEMLEARKRAEEQAARYAEAEQSKPQAGPKGRMLPGETSDPYYYSGPVDPAFFASTPGVRTARPARVSTERKAYVYPMHPGSEDFDSGTIVAFRGNAQFAPSPLNGLPDRGLPMTEAAGERSDTGLGLTESRRPAAAVDDRDTGYNLDEDYYDGDHVARVFAPSPRTRVRGESAPSDLHIRPASRVSGERERPVRAVRPSPLSLRATPSEVPQQPVEERRVPEIFVETAEPAAVPEASPVAVGSGEEVVRERYDPSPVFLASSAEGRRDAPLQETKSEPVKEHGVPFFSPLDLRGNGEETLPPLPFEKSGLLEDVESPRMFLPGPRRRVLQTEAEPTLEETRQRDAAAAEGEVRSQAEAESRDKLDRFVQDAEGARAPVSDVSPGMLAEAVLKSGEVVAHQEQTVQWRSLPRTGESGFRRRRQPGREPVARTVRQPRSQQDAESVADHAAPPAWLSGERVPAQPAEAAKVEGGAGPDVPATPGDPGVPGPRPVLRRQPSNLRPRSQRSNPEVRPTRASSDPNVVVAGPLPETADTLQQSRERVAARWFALSGLMGSERQSGEPRVGERSGARPAPLLSVLSISGGVGKTSIVATLGRALSALGEKVMLADTNVHGILPYYFGAREQKPGAVRTFSPPPGSSDAPVVLVSYDADGRAYDDAGQKRVLEDLHRRSSQVQRVLVDAGVNSAWLARAVAGTNPWVLVPVAPDMNSVLGTQAVERLFQDVTGIDGRPVKPYYVLNQYDPSMPLHLDVREVLRQFLGDRLLPIMLQRTPVVSEALAEGMTVIDYAPRAPIATDYMNLANWVRKLADPGLSYARPARWSER